jgi:hypothetical protein
MKLYDAIQFSIADGKIYCQTPRDGVEINAFLHTMRRSLDAWRSNSSKPLRVVPPASCAYPPVESAGECVK